MNEVVNIIYHMENQELNRYVGNYDKFLEVYEAKKAQQEAAYRKQQQEINELKDFVARNKARVATRNMAMSRQKKLDNMDVIELAKEKPKPEFYFKEARTPGKMLFETEDLIIGYDKNAPLSKPINLRMERGEKIAIIGTNGIGKSTLLKVCLVSFRHYPVRWNWATICIRDISNRRWQARTTLVWRRSGRNFRDILSMRCDPHWQNVDLRRSISRARCAS